MSVSLPLAHCRQCTRRQASSQQLSGSAALRSAPSQAGCTAPARTAPAGACAAQHNGMPTQLMGIAAELRQGLKARRTRRRTDAGTHASLVPPSSGDGPVLYRSHAFAQQAQPAKAASSKLAKATKPAKVAKRPAARIAEPASKGIARTKPLASVSPLESAVARTSRAQVQASDKLSAASSALPVADVEGLMPSQALHVQALAAALRIIAEGTVLPPGPGAPAPRRRAHGARSLAHELPARAANGVQAAQLDPLGGQAPEAAFRHSSETGACASPASKGHLPAASSTAALALPWAWLPSACLSNAAQAPRAADATRSSESARQVPVAPLPSSTCIDGITARVNADIAAGQPCPRAPAPWCWAPIRPQQELHAATHAVAPALAEPPAQARATSVAEPIAFAAWPALPWRWLGGKPDAALGGRVQRQSQQEAQSVPAQAAAPVEAPARSSADASLAARPEARVERVPPMPLVEAYRQHTESSAARKRFYEWAHVPLQDMSASDRRFVVTTWLPNAHLSQRKAFAKQLSAQECVVLSFQALEHLMRGQSAAVAELQKLKSVIIGEAPTQPDAAPREWVLQKAALEWARHGVAMLWDSGAKAGRLTRTPDGCDTRVPPQGSTAGAIPGVETDADSSEASPPSSAPERRVPARLQVRLAHR
jgi:hypothetical protein